MICSFCGKEGATESDGSGGRIHDWCSDSLMISRSTIIEFFNTHGFLVTSDALDKLMNYSQVLNQKKLLAKILNNAIKECARMGDYAIFPKHIIIEVELSFSSI